MKRHLFSLLTLFLLALTTFVAASQPVTATEPAPETLNVVFPAYCTTAVDLLYVLDISGSMNEVYGKEPSKLVAAKQAISVINDAIADVDNGSRIALITYHGNGGGVGSPPIFPTDVRVKSGFTTYVPGFNNVVNSLTASSNTPSSTAIDMISSWSKSEWANDHVPIVVFISDGVPTVSSKLHGFADGPVAAVNIYNPATDAPYSSGQVAYMGQASPVYANEFAGRPLADMMNSIHSLKQIMPQVTVNSLAINSGPAISEYNDQIMRYVSEVGEGEFYTAGSIYAFVDALEAIFVDGACPNPPTPTPPPPTPSPTPIPPTPTPPPPPPVCGQPQTIPFYAGQTIEIGSVTVSNDNDNLLIELDTSVSGWLIDQTHLAAATSLAAIPQNSGGNPEVGQFPYQTTHLPTVDTFSYSLPLSSLGFVPGDNLFVATHASALLKDQVGTVIQRESAWGEGPTFPGGNWATYFNYVVQSCDAPPPPPPDGIFPGDFRTQTQGGWGSGANGNNPGVYRDANFAAAFPNGLTIGHIDGHTAVLNSAAAVEIFLPQGGPAAALGANYNDPTATNAAVLAGQVAALTLNVGFDQYDAAFGAADAALADLTVIGDGSPCYGMTVQQVLADANLLLAGLPVAFTASEINSCAAGINENFVDGNSVGEYLGWSMPIAASGPAGNQSFSWGGTERAVEYEVHRMDFPAQIHSPATLLTTVSGQPFNYVHSSGVTNVAGGYFYRIMGIDSAGLQISTTESKAEFFFAIVPAQK